MIKKPIYGPMNRQFKGSLDSRYSFPLESDLFDYLSNEETAYTGMLTYIEELGALYILKEAHEDPVEKPEVEGAETPETEEEVTYYLDEVIQNSNFDRFLLSSKVFNMLLDKFNELHKTTQEAVDIVQNDIENMVNHINVMQQQINFLLQVTAEDHPDDPRFKVNVDPDLLPDVEVTPEVDVNIDPELFPDITVEPEETEPEIADPEDYEPEFVEEEEEPEIPDEIPQSELEDLPVEVAPDDDNIFEELEDGE